jgi:glucan phosphoethanolaminetransferase (alkaline phosphatase superfamily)
MAAFQNLRGLSLIALGALRLLPLAVMISWAVQAQPPRLVVAIAVAGAVEVFLLASIFRTWRSFFLAGIPFFLVGCLYASYTLLYGSPPGRSLAYIVLTTSEEEIVGFLGLSQSRLPLVGLLGTISVYLLLSLRLARGLRIESDVKPLAVRGLLLLTLLATIYAATYPNDLIDGIATGPTTGTAMFFASTVPSANRTLHGADLVKVPYHAHRDGGEEVHILVVGESVRRDSWSVYGYTRLTTPYLDSLKAEAFFLQHAVADANVTAWSVPILLTGMTPTQFSIGSTEAIHGNLIDLAKEAGYDTAWLLNQDITISVSVGMDPNRLVYPVDFKANFLDRHALDEGMLPGLHRELARTGHPRFIGIHMMGSHWEYYRRYPPSFQRFGSPGGLQMLSIFMAGTIQSRVLDSYDNTVLYSDWFLKQVIESARQLTVPATVTFFPDHGEDLAQLDGSSGHGASRYTRHAFEIPAFVWMNGAFRKAHPEKVTALQVNISKEIRTHDVFGTMADLMGIGWPGAKPARSFASAQFVPDDTEKFGAGGNLIAGPSPQNVSAASIAHRENPLALRWR